MISSKRPSIVDESRYIDVALEINRGKVLTDDWISPGSMGTSVREMDATATARERLDDHFEPTPRLALGTSVSRLKIHEVRKVAYVNAY